MPPRRPRPLAVPVALPQVAPTNVEEWVAPSQSGHPAVRRAQLALDVARLETDKARAGNLPAGAGRRAPAPAQGASPPVKGASAVREKTS